MKSLVERLSTLLILGRVSNLPTVWSNLLAGWFLAGGGNDCAALALLLPGGSFLYVGGMYLNDFCDADFDSQYCPERPIPAGKISRRAVGGMAGLWFAVGIVCLAPFGWLTAGIALLLLVLIVLYDFRHKNVSWAPLVMGGCRFLLYLMSASAVRIQIPWHVFVLGAILGLYVAGITYVARGESRPDKPARWALLLLLLPVVLPFLICITWLRSVADLPVLLSSLLLLLWMAWLFVPLWRKTNRSIGRVVSGLLAGVVLVDMIAVGSMTLFFLFFALALLLQRVIPAT
ncbi:MAG: UbiA family prenyltransferase [Methylacidiphilales bacterium]|nr:UbiA family prenyltransferase [Candidatus Methylacidiphilales bacterium]